MKELRVMASSLAAEAFCEQLGPIALIEQSAAVAAEADPMLASGDVGPTSQTNVEAVMTRMLMLALEMADLVVTTLPPLDWTAELTVGRQPDCDLLIEHPSVSKRHAVLRWDESQHGCTLRDLDSRNGTFVNTIHRIERETVLADGDIVSFGEVAFWLLVTDTLYAKLAPPRSSAPHSTPT